MAQQSELFYRLIKILAILLIATGVANLARLIFWLENDITIFVGIGTFIPLFLVSLRNALPNSKSYFLVSLVPLLLLGFWSYFIGEFGTFDWSSIVFHFSAGLGDSGTVDGYIVKAINAGMAVFFIAIGMLIMKNYINWFGKLDKILAAIILIINPAVVNAAINLVSSEENQSSDQLFKLYSKPEITGVTGNGKPKNFIHIVLESTETTYKNEDVFGQIMRPIRPYEEQGLSAEALLQVRDTGWSASGYTAAYCGVPLSPLGLARGNYFGTITSFMPQASCLGDVLKDRGYNLSYVTGADIEFASFDKILGHHGFDNLVDFNRLLEIYPDNAKAIIKDGRTSFGSNDDITFKGAYKVLRESKAKNAPFGITIMTNGGHAPGGNFSPTCNGKPEIDPDASSSLKAIHCSNLLASDFIENAKKEGLLENTIVIMQSDHYAMKNEVFSQLFGMKRSNLFVISGSGLEHKIHSKPSSMLDVYPTILEAIGFELKGNKAGLGISLLSDKPTLLEEKGMKALNTMIRNDYKLRYTLWADKNNSLEKYISSLD